MTRAVDLANSVANGVSLGFKNRIINGAMMIDQRYAGASFTPTVDQVYALDRWTCRLTQASKYSIQQVSDAPAGFVKSLKITSLSAYTVNSTDFFGTDQRIEGLNFYDLGWGTANAQPVTISFWVKSSLTGTFGATMFGYQNGYPSYPFNYTINAANTWEYKTVTIPGSTTGTWPTDNSGSALLMFSLGVGSTLLNTPNTWYNSTLYRAGTGATSLVATNGATWQVTGVQLEVGSTATNFEYRDYGRELIMCQRYYQVLKGQIGVAASTSSINWCTTLLVQMRASPSLSKFGGSNYVFGDMVSAAYGSTGTPTLGYGYNELSLSGLLTGFTGLTAYRSYRHEPAASGNDATLFAVSAEL